MTDDYIPFQIAGEAFVVPAQVVREILGVQTCTKIPHKNGSISGVFPWNGRAIPLLLVDRALGLRRPDSTSVEAAPVTNSAPAFRTENSSSEERSRTLVVETSDDIVGLFVHEVREVVRILPEAFRPVHAADHLFTSAEAEWSGGRVARLLDLEKMVNECFQSM